MKFSIKLKIRKTCSYDSTSEIKNIASRKILKEDEEE